MRCRARCMAWALFACREAFRSTVALLCLQSDCSLMRGVQVSSRQNEPELSDHFYLSLARRRTRRQCWSASLRRKFSRLLGNAACRGLSGGVGALLLAARNLAARSRVLDSSLMVAAVATTLILLLLGGLPSLGQLRIAVGEIVLGDARWVVLHCCWCQRCCCRLRLWVRGAHGCCVSDLQLELLPAWSSARNFRRVISTVRCE